MTLVSVYLWDEKVLSVDQRIVMEWIKLIFIKKTTCVKVIVFLTTCF